jgi:hypothetical protein
MRIGIDPRTWAGLTAVGLLLGCVGRPTSRAGAAQAVTACPGTVVLTVRNRTGMSLEVVEYDTISRKSTTVGSAEPGTSALSVGGGADVLYAVRAPGSQGWLTAENRPSAGGQVELERGCR